MRINAMIFFVQIKFESLWWIICFELYFTFLDYLELIMLQLTQQMETLTLKTKLMPLFQAALLHFQKNLTNLWASSYQLEHLAITQKSFHINLSGTRNILGGIKTWHSTKYFAFLCIKVIKLGKISATKSE